MSIIKQIFTTQTDNGSSSIFSASGVNPNQQMTSFLGLVGNFDGATVRLQWQDPAGDWNNTDTAIDSWTSEKLQPLYLNSFHSYRLNLTGAGINTSIDAWAFGAN